MRQNRTAKASKIMKKSIRVSEVIPRPSLNENILFKYFFITLQLCHNTCYIQYAKMRL